MVLFNFLFIKESLKKVSQLSTVSNIDYISAY